MTQVPFVVSNSRHSRMEYACHSAALGGFICVRASHEHNDVVGAHVPLTQCSLRFAHWHMCP